MDNAGRCEEGSEHTQQLSGLLIAPDLSESNGAWAVSASSEKVEGLRLSGLALRRWLRREERQDPLRSLAGSGLVALLAVHHGLPRCFAACRLSGLGLRYSIAYS